MLIDGNDFEPEILETDICVIGTGIGGGTLVNGLVAAGQRFVVVEAGNFGKNSTVLGTKKVGRDFGLRSTTHVGVGGTSNLWHGVLSPLDEMDFSARDWVPNSGWPIGAQDLEPYYQDAAQVLGVETYEYFSPAALSETLKESLDSLTFHRSVFKNKIFQQPVPPVNFKHVIKKLLSRSEDQHCLYNAVALELRAEGAGTNVTSLVVGRAGTGKTLLVKAKRFVVAAGALESPRLLLNSRRGALTPALANENIGRYLMDHPMGNLCQVELKKPLRAHIYSDTRYGSNMKIKTGLELQDELQRKHRLGNHNFFFRASFKRGIHNDSEKIKLSLLAFKDGGVSLRDVWKLLTNLNVVAQILAYKFSLNVKYRFADLFFLTEQYPEPSNRVILSETRDAFGYPVAEVHWHVPESEIQQMNQWFRLVKEETFPDSHYEFSHAEKDLNWNEIYTSAAHHVGTLRMGATPTQGVVDRNLQVFGVPNLYVCDGSVFTTSGNVNSGFTIAAFACRLCHHLAGQKVSEQTRPLRLAITGGTGFIGSVFLRQYAQNYAEIKSLQRSDSGSLPNLQVVRGDLAASAALGELVGSADVLLHMAFDATYGDNRGAARTLIESCRKSGVKGIVYLSSAAVYGTEDRDVVINENTPYTESRDPYASEKKYLESLFAAAAAEGIRVIILQPSIVYGGSGGWDRASEAAAHAKRWILPYGGEGLCNAVHVDDVASAIESAVRVAALPANKITPDRVIVAGGDVTWLEYYRARLASASPAVESAHAKYSESRPKALIFKMWFETLIGLVLNALLPRLYRLKKSRAGAKPAPDAPKTYPEVYNPQAMARRYHAQRGRLSSVRALPLLGYRPRVKLDGSR
ncbi:MAG TPA: GMC family oxidoreductase [Bdellovibrionota bacterium]|jgi:choline dehydrogenase-like flavoprotein|nr:GMC family oxidoreductase [Bdellovibrionota bacterium]